MRLKGSMIMKKLLFVLLTIVLVISMTQLGIAPVSAAQSGVYTYTVTNSKAEITNYTGTGGAVSIPSKLGVYTVTKIGEEAFADCTGLTSVTIPSSVISIGDNAFIHCLDLKQILVDITNNQYSSVEGVLFNKTKSTLLQYPSGKTGSYIIPKSVTNIGINAFAYSGLTSVTIGSGVTNLGEGAFACCSGLTSVTIPNNVTSLGDASFAFSGLTSVTIGSKVTVIGKSAFAFTGLTSVAIPNNVISIADGAFAFTGLTKATIGTGVTNIGENAFAFTGLTSITLGSGVKTIGEGAFTYTGLTSAYFLGNAPTMGTGVFDHCASTFKVYYISGKTGFTNPWKGYKTATFLPLTKPTLSRNPKTPTNGNVTVTITYPSNASLKEYKIGSSVWKAYTTPLILNTNDTVYARCSNSSGTSPVGSIYVDNIDKVTPIITGVSNGGVYNVSKTITFNEGTATLNGNSFLSGGSASNDGIYTLIVTDAAMNKTTSGFTIDKTLPAISLKTTGGTLVSSGSCLNASIVVNATDANLLSKEIKKNGAVITWPTNNTLTKDGLFTITVKDKAGNVRTATFIIDKTAPKIVGKNLSGVDVPNNDSAIGGVTFSFTEVNLKTKVITKDGLAIAWPETNEVTAKGPYKITITDKAGNISTYTFMVT